MTNWTSSSHFIYRLCDQLIDCEPVNSHAEIQNDNKQKVLLNADKKVSGVVARCKRDSLCPGGTVSFQSSSVASVNVGTVTRSYNTDLPATISRRDGNVLIYVLHAYTKIDAHEVKSVAYSHSLHWQ
jgi:hypothetical protein